VFVHAPSLERVYVDRGVIVNGTIFAYNYFVIAGPSNDPAGIKGLTDPVEAFRRIYYAGEQGKAVFVSRGDNSGTHVKELSIWDKAGLDPSDKPWYIEAGQGMGGTLVIAGEKKGYVLTDISTYLKYKAEGRTPQIEALVTQGQDLINIYSVYAVNSCPEDLKGIVNDLIEYVSNDFQEIIANYGLKQYGVPLFNPAAGEEDWLRSEWMRLASGHVNT
jgi:tungstate transport system substrate-binding protein